MKLSRFERLVLANQYRMLEALIPDEAEYLARSRTALEKGYEFEYDQIMQHVYPDGLTDDECREVIHTLGMFEWLEQSYDRLPDKDKKGIEEYPLRFQGYDGNNETMFLTYTEYLFEEGKFQPLLEGLAKRKGKKDFNSHSHVRDTYGRMLAKFDEVQEGRRAQFLNKDEIKAVLDERIHPERRAELAEKARKN